MTKSLANIISVIFHPLLLVTAGAILIFETDQVYRVALPLKLELVYLLILFIGTFVFPSLIIYMLKIKGNIDSLQMPRKEDRWLPLLITALFITLTYYLFTYRIGFHLPYLVKGYLIGTTASIILAAIISYRFKISLHSIAMGGILALMTFLQKSSVYDMRWFLVVWILCCGLVGAARIHLGAHDRKQVYAGYLLGFSVIFILIRS